MVAGMAAMRPIAVAKSASAMPGATTASEVFFEAAIDWKLDMMPQTVPNSPTNGPAEPTVASTSSRRSSRSISRAIETFITFSIRICRPAKDRAWLSNDRFHSRIAATKQAAIDWVGLAESARYSSSIDSPDQNACSKRSMARLLREYRIILSIAIAQTQTEQDSRPSMTIFTTQCAWRNSAISDTSADAIGKAD